MANVDFAGALYTLFQTGWSAINCKRADIMVFKGRTYVLSMYKHVKARREWSGYMGVFACSLIPFVALNRRS